MQKRLITFFETSVFLFGCSELTSDDIQSDEYNVLSSLCATMGSNVRMQFNATGTCAGDI